MLKHIKLAIYLVVLLIITVLNLNLGSGTENTFENEKLSMQRTASLSRLDSITFTYDHYIQHAIDSQVSPGAAVAIVYHGQIILMKGYGVREFGSNEPVDVNTVFRLGSVSKGFAAILTGILVNDGCLSWDDHVAGYLKDFRMEDTANYNRMTVRNILSQTTGFPIHTYTDLLDHGVPYEKIKSSLAYVHFTAKPGQIYSYQNVAYSLIGDVLKDITGEDYTQLLKEKIFEPLHMIHASTDYNTIKNDADAAMPHERVKYTWRAVPMNSRYYSDAPASGINASISDMAQWLLALTGNYPEIISQKTISDVSEANIQTPKKSAYRRNWKSLEKTAYGLGWRVFTCNNKDIIYHGGYVEGYRAEIAFSPNDELGIVVLFNSTNPLASECIPHFFDLLDKAMPPSDKYLADRVR